MHHKKEQSNLKDGTGTRIHRDKLELIPAGCLKICAHQYSNAEDSVLVRRLKVI